MHFDGVGLARGGPEQHGPARLAFRRRLCPGPRGKRDLYRYQSRLRQAVRRPGATRSCSSTPIASSPRPARATTTRPRRGCRRQIPAKSCLPRTIASPSALPRRWICNSLTASLWGADLVHCAPRPARERGHRVPVQQCRAFISAKRHGTASARGQIRHKNEVTENT